MPPRISDIVYRQHLVDVIGTLFGPRPEERIDEIRGLKAHEADYLVRKLELTADHSVMDLGSGMGHVARPLSQRVKRLYCCDVSASFLQYAAAECGGAQNVSFHLKHRTGKFDFLKDGELNAIYSNGVFIHLNIFDVYWYFMEFARVLAPGGLVCFNINSSTDLDPRSGNFIPFAEQFAGNPYDMTGMMEWLDPTAIQGIAKYFGFERRESAIPDKMYLVFGRPA